MENFDIKNFDCNKNIVIEASAGTGKTYTITNIVPHLLSQGYKLSEILIVTYTNKAAGELRSRIREELIKLSQTPSDTISEDLRESIAQQLEHIDDASIGTIHSFCEKILTENYIYSNSSQNMSFVDDKAELDTFVGKYIRDNVARNNTMLYLYERYEKFQEIITDALKKYYLDKNGNENPSVVSLCALPPQEIEDYNKSSEIINNLSVSEFTQSPELPVADSELLRCFVILHLKELYQKWHQEKYNNSQRSYNDMIKAVHDAITESDSKLLQVLKTKYKYAIIDEFQDTNQLQWNIFRQIFTTDKDHHIAIVGDPKQSIFSFRDADSRVYNSAKNQITYQQKLSTNYRCSAPMIDAINVLAGNPDVFDCSEIGGYQNVQTPSEQKIKPAQLNGVCETPVQLIYEPAEDQIISVIKHYCQNKLQIWDKNLNNKKGGYRPVNYGDFAILVKMRKEVDKLIPKMTQAGIPFVWHKDSTLFKTKECTDWITLLSAIQSPDFNSKNREILRRALKTAFFTVDIDEINNEKYNDILCTERQMLLKWRNLAMSRQYSKLIDAILEDSEISKRLSSFDKIQSLSKYTQISNFILDCLIAKRDSIANVINTLKQQKNKQSGDDEISVERGTDAPAVRFSTIHSAKGLEYPIVFYWLRKKPNRKTKYIHVEYSADKPILDVNAKLTEEPDWQSLRYVAITRATSLLFLINTVKSRKKDAVQYVLDEDVLEEHPTLFTLCTLNTSNILSDYNNEKIESDLKTPCDKINMARKKLYKHSYTSLSHRKSNIITEPTDETDENSQRIDKEGRPDLANIISVEHYDPESGTVNIGEGIYDMQNLSKISTDISGTKYGTAVHEIFERIDFSNPNKHLDEIIRICCDKNSIPWSSEDKSIESLIINTMSARFPEVVGNHATGNQFCLADISNENRKSEIEFVLNPDIKKPLLNYCNGFIDLLFVRDINGKKVYSILDWKTDLLKSETDEINDKNYADYRFLKTHTNKNYAIQRVLYSYCLIQWLKQFYPDKDMEYIFNNHFGGMYYVYVRGCNTQTSNGIYVHTWKNYTTLSDAFNNIITKGIYNG